MSVRRTRSCPAQLALTHTSPAVKRRAESPTDLRAEVRKQTDNLIDQNLREAASVRAPGVGGQPLMSAAGVRLSTYAWNFSAPATDLIAPDLRGDRFGLTAGLPAFGDHLMAGFYGDTVQFGDSHQGNHGWGSSGFVSFRRGECSPGLGVGLYCPGGVTVGLSFNMKIIGRSDTRVLAVDHGRFLVTQSARRAWGPQAGFGAGLSLTGPLPWVGLVGRFARQYGESTSFTRWVGPECLMRIESDDPFKQAAVAWGLRPPHVAWPTQGATSALPMLEVGERLTRGIDDNMRCGLSMALVGLVNGTHRGRDERANITMERLDETTLRFAHIVEQAAADTCAAELPIFANAEQTRVKSRAMEQVFDCDMRFTEGRAAACALWGGKLPDGAWTADVNPPAAQWLVHLAEHDALPTGVTRTRVAWLQRPYEVHGSVAAGLPWYTPRWIRAGREQFWRTSSDGCLGWFAGEVRRSHRWQTSVDAQRYHSDARTRSVMAHHEQSITADGAQPGSTRVTMQWRYGRFGSRARTAAVDWLNKHLLADAPLPPFAADCLAGPYTLDITRDASTLVPSVGWSTAETCLSKTLDAPDAFVDLCANLRRQGDQAMPWLHSRTQGVAADFDLAPARPDLQEHIHAAYATRTLQTHHGDHASLHERALRIDRAAALRTALTNTKQALEADPIAQRFNAAACGAAILATQRAIDAVTPADDTVAKLDAELARCWGADAF